MTAGTPHQQPPIIALDRQSVYIHETLGINRMHHVGRFEEHALHAPIVFHGHSSGYRQAELVNRGVGSVHTGLSMNELATGGAIDWHLHAFEESFYILSGDAVVSIGSEPRHYRLGPGDYGAFKVGTPHAWRAVGDAPVRWLQMSAPQPKPLGAERDTFFPRSAPERPADASRLDLARLDGNLLGHFDASQIP